MSINGVTQTAQALPLLQMQTQPQAVSSESGATPTGADAANLSEQVSARELDTTQRQSEDAEIGLISNMAAVTGIGSNIDISV